MRREVCLLVGVATALSCLAADPVCRPQAPCYSADSIVSAASGAPAALAPNSLASIYGTGLSYVERAISGADILAGELPTVLPGTGVRVLVGGIPAHIYYVSPGQVNFLIPSNIKPSPVTAQLTRDGTAGPAVQVTLREKAPALFQLDLASVVASHEDYSVVTQEAPARPGEWVILWATGLGPVVPPAAYGKIPTQAAQIKQLDSFQVLLDGVPVSPDRVGYVGVAPGWGGLYQINVKLPEDAPVDPEVRIAIGAEASPAALRLWAGPPAN
ncbi:MAG TPA: hypothetical protein VLH09_04495 [Bryobacteraceae bacterium]|nr:hypothetical protein [Bryobacteraceae bacterium]